MQSIPEKLELFDRLMLSDATRARNAILDQLRSESDAAFERTKDEIEREASLACQKDIRRITAEKESRLSKANMNAKKMLINARSEILDSILGDLCQKLESFTETAQYRRFMEKNVGEALARAGLPEKGEADGKIEADGRGYYIIFTPRDYGEYSDEALKYARGLQVRTGGSDMIGGVIVENLNSGVFIDNTLRTKAQLCADELFQISRLTIGG